MKRTIFCVLAAVALSAFSVQAKTRGGIGLGITGGYTSSTSQISELSARSISRYNVGLIYNIPLPSGFALQPGVVYCSKGVSCKGEMPVGDLFVNSMLTKVGYVEVPVQAQWGPDLLLFRPYVLLEPFIGCGVDASCKIGTAVGTVMGTESANTFEGIGIGRFEYGCAAGIGIQFWKMQLSAKYYLNFNRLPAGGSAYGTMKEAVKNAFTGPIPFHGVMVQASILF